MHQNKQEFPQAVLLELVWFTFLHCCGADTGQKKQSWRVYFGTQFEGTVIIMVERAQLVVCEDTAHIVPAVNEQRDKRWW